MELYGHLKQASSGVLYVPPNPVLVEVLLLAAPKRLPPVFPELAPKPVLLDCPKPEEVSQFAQLPKEIIGFAKCWLRNSPVPEVLFDPNPPKPPELC